MSTDPRVGLGCDVHRLEPGGSLVLGNVEITDAGVHAVGHSDGDAVLHALTDAILGACGQGDIGELFPPGDPLTRDADSRLFVEAALDRAHALGFRIASADVVVIAERPRLGAWKPRIRERLAAILGLPPDRTGLQAKTAEGLGDIGAGRALEARAVVLLMPQTT